MANHRKKGIQSPLWNVPLFSDLAEDEMRLLRQATISRKHSKNTVILYQDEPGDRLYVVASGTVKVVIFGEDDREVSLATLGPGEFFGEMALFDDEPRSASVVAAEDCELLVLRREDFFAEMAKRRQILTKVVREMCRRLRHANEKIRSLALLDVYGRVVEAIRDLAVAKGVSQGNDIVIPKMPTHNELAHQVGATRETVSRIIKSLKDTGSISYRGRAVVVHGEIKR